MFKEHITSTPLTSSEASGFFGNINATGSIDSTLVSTARALVGPRLAKDKTYMARVRDKETRKGRAESLDSMVFITAVAPESEDLFTNNTSLTITNFTGDGASETMDRVEAELNNIDLWEKIEKVTVFYKKTMRVLCYVNRETLSSLVISENMGMAEKHYLQCGLLVFTPWIIEESDIELSEKDMRLIESLRFKSSKEYIEALLNIANEYNFREERIKNLLANFEVKFIENEIRRLDGKISQRYMDIEGYRLRIAESLSEIRIWQEFILGKELGIKNGSVGGVMDYFLANKNLMLEGVYENSEELRFYVQTEAAYWDEDVAQTIIDNKGSYIYNSDGLHLDEIISEEDMEMLATAVFIDREIKINLSAKFVVSTGGVAWVRALSNQEYPLEMVDSLPNPHLDKHSCLGGYEAPIAEAVAAGNYLGAIEQCIASVKNLNFGDSIVMKAFFEAVYGINEVRVRRFFEADGVKMSSLEAVDYLREKTKGVIMSE